jgi:DNA repair exonuclease SbcCD ATPase subunit
MYRMSYLEAEGFIGLYNGLGKKKVILNLQDYKDKQIFIFLGGNAKGKSTLLSIAHPFSGTTDKRTKFIRKDKEGYKLVIYDNTNDENIKIRIKHVYVPNKDSHSTKSFIHKIIDGKEIDLNPNGNVSSFLVALDQEFGIGEDFLRLSAQNEDMVGLVKMTGAERKDHIYKFLPKADDTTLYQRVIMRKHRDVKVYLSSIIDKLGKMDDAVTVQEKLKEIESFANELVEKRDKTIGKINNYKTELKTLDPEGKLESDYKEIKSNLKELEKSQDKLLNKVKSYQDDFSIETLEECNKKIEEIATLKNSIWQKVVQLSSVINVKKMLKQSLYDQIEEKQQLLNQLTGTNSKDDIGKLLKEYEDKLSTFDKRIKKLNTPLTADDLIRGIDILAHLREFMYDLYTNCDSKKIMEESSKVIFDKRFESRHIDSREKLEKIKSKVMNITSNLDKLSGFEYLKDSIDKRPKECVIDSCAFLQDYHKWTQIDAKIKTFEADLKEVNGDYQSLIEETGRYYEIARIKSKMENLLTFYKSNYSLISKLPFNDKYSTEKKLIERLIDYDTLSNAEEPFYEVIEVLQDKSEYEEIRNIKIPNLKIELERVNNNHGLLASIQKDLTKLNEKYDKMLSDIKKEDKELEDIEDKYEDIEKKDEILKEMKEFFVKIHSNKDEIIKLADSFEKLKAIASRIEELNEKLDEREQKLKIIDHKLRPLTQERDKYKYQEIKIIEYNMEKEKLEENLQILGLVRDALSTNKGMIVNILNMYVDEIRRAANLLLSETFDGTLHLEQFEIDDKEFSIPMQHNGERNPDISKGSSSERAFISSCLSMALIEQIIAEYGILNLDEVDSTMSVQNKAIFCHILMKQIKRVGITQVFMITHNYSFYEAYGDNVVYILFPEHDFDTRNKDYIKIA